MDAKEQLLNIADKEKALFLSRFFKTGKGEYGEGDKFLGIKVPQIRAIAKQNTAASTEEIVELLKDSYHECRLCALFILVQKFKKAE